MAQMSAGESLRVQNYLYFSSSYSSDFRIECTFNILMRATTDGRTDGPKAIEPDVHDAYALCAPACALLKECAAGVSFDVIVSSHIAAANRKYLSKNFIGSKTEAINLI